MHSMPRCPTPVNCSPPSSTSQINLHSSHVRQGRVREYGSRHTAHSRRQIRPTINCALPRVRKEVISDSCLPSEQVSPPH